MKKVILLVVVIILIVAGWIYFTKNQSVIVSNFEGCVVLGNPVMESYPRQCRTADGRLFVEDIGNELGKIDLVRVNSPRPNTSIASPLLVKGEARGYWFFEADFPVKLYDDNDNLLGMGVATALSDWMTEEFVSFEVVFDFYPSETKKGKLVLEKDNPSGLPENDDELIIPVYFQETETMTVKAFFSNSNLDPEVSCVEVFPVERRILKTQATARAALTELLKGPNEKEIADGYLTSINPGVKIQSLVIEDGIARVDFDEQLEYQVGGSCRVSAISHQIIETLKQFPTVKDVIISIDGRTEDILQP